MKQPGAFTLIELLIVVAIIGLLAAIAVPNFSNAVTRAKVARANSDLRTLASALEMYQMDHGNYPYVLDGGIEWQMPAGFPPNHVRGPAGLTTPTPYLTAALRDPFLLQEGNFGNNGNPLLYYERCGFGFNSVGEFLPIKPVRMPVDAFGSLEGTAPDYNESDPRLIPAAWVVYSVGPDRTHRIYDAEGNILLRSRFSRLNRYDPSNGTVSAGNVVGFPGGRFFPE